MIISTIDRISVTSFNPAKKRKQLKKLLNILSPSIKYAKNYNLCLTFAINYNIILNEKRKVDVFISPD